MTPPARDFALTIFAVATPEIHYVADAIAQFAMIQLTKMENAMIADQPTMTMIMRRSHEPRRRGQARRNLLQLWRSN